MYPKLDQFSVLNMSKSELQFLVKDDKKEMKFNIVMRSTLEFQDHECQGIASSHDHHPDELHHDHQEEDESRKEGRKSDDNNDINDGFRTPTSLDHKIPVTKQCPPAPRKSKPLPSRKRKLPSTSTSTSTSRRNLQLLDLSNDVELLFPPHLLADLGRKIKKARKEVDID